MSERAAEELWREFVAALPVTGPVPVGGPASLVLWDTETLGSPRPAVLAPDPRSAPDVGLAWIAAHEPHTWALVLEERYAAGPVASYLVARATRGLVHVSTDPAWSADRAAELGVPRGVLPELARPGTVGRSDPRIVGRELELRL